MAYNNGFPVGYGQLYPQISPYNQIQQMQMQQQQQQQQSNLIWVQGEAGAKSYQLAPNTTMPLWDSEAQVIYLKSADGSGMPSMKVLDYTVRENPSLPPKPVTSDSAEYATKNEVETIKDKVETIKDSLTHEINTIKESLGIE